MGAVSSSFQSLLFGVVNVVTLSYIASNLKKSYGISLKLLPRIILFHFCMNLIMGLVFIQSISVRLDPIKGAIIGPLGTFLATLIFLYISSVLALFTSEYIILVASAYAVAFAYGRAKYMNKDPARIQTWFVMVFFLIGLLAIMVPDEIVDEIADGFGSYLKLDQASEVPPNYLTSDGGVFMFPWFSGLVVAGGSYALIKSQTSSFT